MADVISKKWCTTFGLNCDVEDVAANPTIHTLVKEYKQSIDKENEKRPGNFFPASKEKCALVACWKILEYLSQEIKHPIRSSPE